MTGRAYLCLGLLALTPACAGRWVPLEEDCPEEPKPPLIVVDRGTVPNAGVSGRFVDSAVGVPLHGVTVFVAPGTETVDTVVSPDTTFEVHLASGRETVLRFQLIGYGVREDTLAVRPGEMLLLDVPLIPRALDGCSFPAAVWKPWWKIW